MMKRHRWLIYILVLATLLPAALNTARAEDREIKAITAHLTTRYQAKRKRIPFLGLAKFAVRVVHPAGVKSIKLTMFEDLNYAGRFDHAELNAVIRDALDEQWQPLVRISSRKAGEQMFVYARHEGQDIKLMVVNLQETEAFIARIKLNPLTLAKWMEKPEILGISLASR
jgi:predicted small secreted protein